MFQYWQQPLVEQPTPASGQDDGIPAQCPTRDTLVGICNPVEQQVGGFLGFFLARVLSPTALKDARGNRFAAPDLAAALVYL